MRSTIDVVECVLPARWPSGVRGTGRCTDIDGAGGVDGPTGFELSLQLGDVVRVLATRPGGWQVGKRGGAGPWGCTQRQWWRAKRLGATTADGSWRTAELAPRVRWHPPGSGKLLHFWGRGGGGS